MRKENFVPISVEQIFKLEEIKGKRNSFLGEFGDECDEKYYVPQLFIYFPPEIKSMKEVFLEKIKSLSCQQSHKELLLEKGSSSKKKLKETQSPLSNSLSKSKPKMEINNTKEFLKSNSDSDDEEQKIDTQKQIKPKTFPKKKSSEEDNQTKNKQGFSFKNRHFNEDLDSDIDKTNENNIGRLLNESLIMNNKVSSDSFFSDYEKVSVEKDTLSDIDEKKKKKLVKKFKLTKEKYFFLNNFRTKNIRNTIKEKTTEKNLEYSITKKAFFLEAKSSKDIENLEETYEIFKKRIKRDLEYKMVKYRNQAEFHVFKKIFHGLKEYKKNFEDMNFLCYDVENKEALVFYFKPGGTHIEELIDFVKKKSGEQIRMIMIPYKSRDNKPIFIKKQKFYPIIVQEGKLASKFFDEVTDLIEEDLKKKDHFGKLNCQSLVYKSSIKENKEYANSFIFFWNHREKMETSSESEKFKKFLGALKQKFYNERRFCFFLFKNIVQTNFQVNYEEDMDLYHSKITDNNKQKIFFYGKPNTIFSVLNSQKSLINQAINNSKKFRFITKFIDADKIFFEFLKEEFKSIKEAKKFKNEENSYYISIKFKSKKFDDFSEDLKKILELSPFVEDRKRTEKRKDDFLSGEFFSKSKEKMIKKSALQDEKSKMNSGRQEYEVSDDFSDDEEQCKRL